MGLQSKSGGLGPRSAKRGDPCMKTCLPGRGISLAEGDAGVPGMYGIFSLLRTDGVFLEVILKTNI